jgi:hypothetical protein
VPVLRNEHKNNKKHLNTALGSLVLPLVFLASFLRPIPLHIKVICPVMAML